LRSRAAALLAAAGAHLFAIYVLIAWGYARPDDNGPSVTPIDVRLIDRVRPPVEAPVRINPKLADVRVRPPQPVPDFQIDVPADPSPTPSGKPDTPVVGAPGLSESGGQLGGATPIPLQLTVTHYVAPVYSPAAVRAGKHGRIVMALQVNARGDVDQVKVLQTTGSSQLDDAAVRAARQWKFAPDKTGARKQPVWGQVSQKT
jgi:protein TonB